MLDDARIAKYHGMRGNIYIYITIWCYQHVITNGYISHYCRINADPHSIAYRRVAFARAPVHLTDNHALVDVAVATYFSFTIDGDIIGMTYINTPPWDLQCLFPILFCLTITETQLYIGFSTFAFYNSNIFGINIAKYGCRFLLFHHNASGHLGNYIQYFSFFLVQ